jgi:enhancing lycopene biosynthesis protein 2
MKKIAVILCGSGCKDGSEIHESVGVLWALSQQKAKFQCFAPDRPQADVVNGLTGQPATGETRNMLVESARIARGEVLALNQFKASDFDALIIPGGFGAAKNLCTFAKLGSKGSVIPELQSALEAMHAAKKPIGAVCIAPTIIALAFRGKGIELTVGEPCEVSQEIEKLGHKHRVCRIDQCHTDSMHRVVTTPAYMYDNAELVDIFKGIQSLVEQVVRLA